LLNNRSTYSDGLFLMVANHALGRDLIANSLTDDSGKSICIGLSFYNIGRLNGYADKTETSKLNQGGKIRSTRSLLYQTSLGHLS